MAGENTVGDRLAALLEECGLSKRGLARRLAGENAPRAQVERWRRSLTKWIAGEHLPSPTNARLLADALGCEPSMFRPTTEERAERRSLAERVARLERRMDAIAPDRPEELEAVLREERRLLEELPHPRARRASSRRDPKSP